MCTKKRREEKRVNQEYEPKHGKRKRVKVKMHDPKVRSRGDKTETEKFNTAAKKLGNHIAKKKKL